MHNDLSHEPKNNNIKKSTEKTYPVSLLHTIMIFLIIASAGIFFTVYFFLSHETDAILDLMRNKIILSKAESVKNAINYYVDIPRQANSIMSHALQENESHDDSLMHARAELHNVMDNVFAGNNYLCSVAFGSVKGDYVGIARKNNARTQEYLTLKSPATNNALTFYYGTSEASGIEDVLHEYNLFVRPWYAEVNKTRQSSWTQAYRDMNSTQGVSISYSSPVYNKKGDFAGVVSSDLHLSELNTFLNTLRPFPDSILLVLNEKNQIVSASEDNLTTGAPQGRLADQYGLNLPSVFESSSSSVRAVGLLLKASNRYRLAETTVNNERNFVLIMSLGEGSQLSNWKGIVVVPERALIQEMNHYRHLTLLICLAIFTLGLALILVVISKVISPLKLITRKTDDLVNQRWELSKDKWHFPEIAQLDQAFFRLSQKLTNSFLALEKQIHEDPTSGLMSRAGLIKKLAEHPTDCRNLLAVVCTTNMSTISNSLGNEYAHRYLNEFILHIKSSLPSGTLICRDAIDKFILVFPGCTSEQESIYYQYKLSTLLGDSRTSGNYNLDNYVFSGNGGMVRQNIDVDSISSIIMNAYIALKFAQQDGQAQVKIYEISMREEELNNIRLHESLRQALVDEEFYLVLQPIVNIKTGECHEGECLIRWESPQWGRVPPDRFILLAEETGLMPPLGNWVINKACEELQKLIARGAPVNFKLHINISATQLLQPDFSFSLLDAIKRYELRNANICIEITETVLLKEISRTSETLGYLRRHGVSVAIDDFGSGFSSLSYLHKLPFDTIKIDRNFVSGVLNDHKSESIISAVIVLAEGFNVPLIAEGIENEYVRERLIDLGCTKAQGYHFSRPARFDTYHCEDGIFIYAQ